MIKLEDIIATKTYQIPYPPDELFRELDDALNPDELAPDCPAWICLSEGIKTRYYLLNPEYHDLILTADSDATKDDYRALLIEFQKNRFENANKVYKELSKTTPTEIRVLITYTDEGGCKCTVLCYPSIYTNLKRELLNEDNITEFNIINSKHECSLFLDELFIGMLEGTLINDILKNRFEYKLLINDASNREITNEIDEILENATTEISICGWIGTHYLPTLIQLHNQGVRLRFMIHRPSEARGQSWKSEIEEARNIITTEFGLETISDAHNIHGRTIIVDNKAIIGSLDMNSASLMGTHTEFAISTDDPKIVRRMRMVFNSKFQPLSTA